jgi:hypothetical protein
VPRWHRTPEEEAEKRVVGNDVSGKEKGIAKVARAMPPRIREYAQSLFICTQTFGQTRSCACNAQMQKPKISPLDVVLSAFKYAKFSKWE